MTPATRRRTQTSRLQHIVGLVRRHYGAPAHPVTTDLFGLILWEQVGYLVDDARRLRAFRQLEAEVGLSASEVLAAPKTRLIEIAKRGGTVAANERAERMQHSARLVRDEWGGDLGSVLNLPDGQAKRALAKFPMIGAPGAEKLLLIAKQRRGLPLESNGLRVLVRLGYGRSLKSYAATYRSVQAAIEHEIRRDFRWLLAAHQLLRRHGKELCRRSVPRCDICPIAQGCPFIQQTRKRGA